MNNYSQITTTTKNQRGRYEWIDVLKFLGIFAIYLGHCIDTDSNIYYFLFEYHVPLFFFAAGLFASKDLNQPLTGYVVKKAKQLLVPYACFSAIAIVIFGLIENMGPRRVVQVTANFVFAMRNTLVAGSLWFIPCIFFVSLLYFIINKVIKNKYAVVAVVLGFFLISQTVLAGKGPGIFNIYSAMYYIVFYAIGDLSFKKITEFKYENLERKNKVLFIFVSALTIFITAITYFWGSGQVVGAMFNKIPALRHIPLFKPMYLVVIATVIIYVNILLAFNLRQVKLFQLLGRNTLALCGTENIVRSGFNTTLAMFGLTLTLNSPLASVIYTFITILMSNYICQRIFKPYFPFVIGKNSRISGKEEHKTSKENYDEEEQVLVAG